MSTYLRDTDRFESTFPSIRNRTGLLESTQRSRITTLDDDIMDTNMRASQGHATYTTTVHRREDGRGSPVFYPRPPSPNRENRKLMMEVGPDAILTFSVVFPNSSSFFMCIISAIVFHFSFRIKFVSFEKSWQRKTN